MDADGTFVVAGVANTDAEAGRYDRGWVARYGRQGTRQWIRIWGDEDRVSEMVEAVGDSLIP